MKKAFLKLVFLKNSPKIKIASPYFLWPNMLFSNETYLFLVITNKKLILNLEKHIVYESLMSCSLRCLKVMQWTAVASYRNFYLAFWLFCISCLAWLKFGHICMCLQWKIFNNFAGVLFWNSVRGFYLFFFRFRGVYPWKIEPNLIVLLGRLTLAALFYNCVWIFLFIAFVALIRAKFNLI